MTTRPFLEVEASARGTGNADALFGSVYTRLKSMAHRELNRVGGNTLNTTALVHELYVKVCTGRDPTFGEPAQFLVYASRAMRHILVDRAQGRLRIKAGGMEEHVSLTHPGVDGVSMSPQLALQLDAALTALENDDARAARVVELHYFGGLSLDRVAEVLGVVRRTVDRDWRYARAFLFAQVE